MGRKKHRDQKQELATKSSPPFNMESHDSSQMNAISSKNCAVCFGSYISKGRRPRSLPCGHTFCTKCITKNLRDNVIACPSCRETSEAHSSLEFPINFGLENVLQEFTSSDSFADGASSPTGKEGRTISKKLRSLRQELITGVEELGEISQDINSQLHQYDSQMEMWKEDHVSFTTQLDDMVKAIEKESQRVKDAIKEEEDERKKMELARDNLISVSTTNEILLAIEEVNLCREDLESWTHRANESFPNVELIKKSKELRERYRIEALEMAKNGIGDATDTDYREEAIGLASASSSADTGVHISTPENSGGLVAASLTVQDKIEKTMENAIFWKASKSVQTDDILWHESQGQLAPSSSVMVEILSLNVKRLLKSTMSMFFKRQDARDEGQQ